MTVRQLHRQTTTTKAGDGTDVTGKWLVLGAIATTVEEELEQLCGQCRRPAGMYRGEMVLMEFTII